MVNVLIDYKVSLATVRDVHQLRRLEQIVFGEDAYTYLSLANLLMWPGGANFKAVDARANVVGFVAGSPNYSTHTDWIVTLGVHPDHQRRGLGRLLLVTCEDAMTQSTLALTVRMSNRAAIELYESAGYQASYTEPHYYNDGEDGLVMMRERRH